MGLSVGFGDEILALGRAEAIYSATGKPVSIRDKAGKPRSHDLWRGNPAWGKNASDSIVDCPGARPYIKRWAFQKEPGQYAEWNMDHVARAGRVWLDEHEREHFPRDAEQYAVISPHVKENASPNKQWGSLKWEQVIIRFPIPVYQLGPRGTEIIQGARHFETPTMRQAAAAVARAKLVLSNEGGIHHLAASMGTRAVVVFGAFIPPAITGYANHENLAIETELGFCGRWQPCEHCQKAMAEITPDMVKEKALAML